MQLSDSQFVLLQDLLSSIRQRLERAVAGTRLPPWPPTATAASRRATIFLARRFGKALRLLRNIVAFDGVLPRRLDSSTHQHISHIQWGLQHVLRTLHTFCKATVMMMMMKHFLEQCVICMSLAADKHTALLATYF